jgi:hypothetical protein
LCARINSDHIRVAQLASRVGKFADFPKSKGYQRVGNRNSKISTSTVFVLGAGASAPYGFDTGERLLERARALTMEAVPDLIQPLPAHGASVLHDALVNTGDLSIDAMLETRGNIQALGKALNAHLLLGQEREALRKHHTSGRGGYRTLFTAMDAPSPQHALAQNVRFLTFNYDRSLEYCLAHAWREKFNPDQLIDPTALGRMFIHLHGQLGFLPEIGGLGQAVSYGGSQDHITETDILGASRAVRIVSEPHTNEPQFVQAREALAAADRVVFLGLGFAPRNVARLQLQVSITPGAAIFACASGFSRNRMVKFIRTPLEPWAGKVIGDETEDAYEFLRLHPEALD